jgi:hypothetical protein
MEEDKPILIKAAGIWIGTLFKSNKFYYIGLEIIPPKEDGIPTAVYYYYFANKSLLVAKYSLSTLYNILLSFNKKYHIILKPIFIGMAAGMQK